METVPVKLCAGSLSAKHGLKWANRDKSDTARELYEDYPGFPLVTLAKDARVQRQTAYDHVKDILARFRATKEAVIMRLDTLGRTQEEVSEQLKTLYPEAKGTTRRN
jgi:hypothetical protein